MDKPALLITLDTHDLPRLVPKLSQPAMAGFPISTMIFYNIIIVTRILIATSNRGKLRDFSAAASAFNVEVVPLPGFDSLPSVAEDGATFAANARKKAIYYSPYAPQELVLADDSGLEVLALEGRPGVLSARYALSQREPGAAEKTSIGGQSSPNPHSPDLGSIDEQNNDCLLRKLAGVRASRRDARFVCVLAAARQEKVINTFRGEVQGLILENPRGSGGFGYDPLFYLPALGRTMAELSLEERIAVGHRGQAFKKFLEWRQKV